MKLNNIEGSVDEILAFCERSKIDGSSLVHGDKATNVKWWYILISAVGYLTSLILYRLDFNNEVYPVVFHGLTLLFGIATIVLFALRCKDNKAFYTVLLGTIVTYLIITKIFSPRELVEKAEQHYIEAKKGK